MKKSNDNCVRKPLMGYNDVVIQEDESKCCSCTPSWVKTFLIFFTAIILLVALVFVGLGSYLVATRLAYIPKLLGEVAYVNHFLLFSIGLSLIAVCIFGFVGVSKKDPKLLMAFCWILGIIVCVQLATGILALCFSEFFQDWLAGRMRSTMQKSYAINVPDVDSAVDYVQQKFKCCGSHNYHDWKESVFQNASERISQNELGFDYDTRVPDSCCIRLTENCGVLPHPSNVYHQGCMDSIFGRLRDRYYIICVVALSLVAVEFCGVILAYCYARAAKRYH
ncbi:cd63 antigen [Clonorchis sinensis]|uniref:Tetraspanin n=1 Tax=Clonorchis sinensis TaxID=79923 RepID=A0A8T1MC43_CLOSI|nr:cd63 antigen [Clonorchis sinensis]